MWGIFKKIWAIYKPLRTVILLILFLMVVSNAVQLMWPYIYGKAINSVVAGANLVQILHILGMALGVLVLNNVINYFWAMYELKYFDYESTTYAQRLTLKKLFTLSIGQHRNEHSGLTQSVVTEGQSALKEMMNSIIYAVLPNVVRITFAVAALLILYWKIGLVVLIGLVIAIAIAFIQNHVFMPLVRREREMSQELGKKRNEIIRNAPLVIANTSEDHTVHFIDEETKKRDEFGKAFWAKFVGMTYLVRTMVLDLTLVGSIGAAAYFLSKGELGPGQIVTVILWTSAALSNLGTLTNLQRQLMFSSERLRKYFKVLELDSDIDAVKEPKRLEKISGEIEFNNVSFAYPKKRIIEDDVNSDKTKVETVKVDDENLAAHEALRDVSFNIKPGEHVAFVGASGAGKSTTLLLLLRGSDPQAGSISIDGVDLREIDLNQYRGRLGVVEQSIILFDDTMRQNISFGLPNGRQLTDEELERLAKIARIDEFKDKLINGWDTLIGENGIKLSGGQRQRVGIARALAKDPAILILDEATSSLDAKNEALIKDALHDASKGRTTIMIAHRLSTVKDADRIFVFDKGKIVGVGKHEELLKTCPTYADLVSHQTVLL